MPLLDPVVPTQTRPFLAEAATVFGKSPGIATGCPTSESFVGSAEEMASIESVLDPALTAKMCFVGQGRQYETFATRPWSLSYLSRYCQRGLAHKGIWSTWISVTVQGHRAIALCAGHRALAEFSVAANWESHNPVGLIVGDHVDGLCRCPASAAPILAVGLAGDTMA